MPDDAQAPPGSYTEADHPFASRGGLKLDFALRESGIDPAGRVAADLGASTGGFVSCLLHRGAARVYAVDTGYGVLDYALRRDERVVVMERSNALHVQPPPELVGPGAEPASARGVDLVTIDLGWTKQAKALAAARRWLSPAGRIITLVKPHYEQPRPTPQRRGRQSPKPEPIDDDRARAITAEVLAQVQADPALGLEVLGVCDSPIRGGKGNSFEMLAWLSRRAAG